MKIEDVAQYVNRLCDERGVEQGVSPVRVRMMAIAMEAERRKRGSGEEAVSKHLALMFDPFVETGQATPLTGRPPRFSAAIQPGKPPGESEG